MITTLLRHRALILAFKPADTLDSRTSVEREARQQTWGRSVAKTVYVYSDIVSLKITDDLASLGVAITQTSSSQSVASRISSLRWNCHASREQTRVECATRKLPTNWYWCNSKRGTGVPLVKTRARRACQTNLIQHRKTRSGFLGRSQTPTESVPRRFEVDLIDHSEIYAVGHRLALLVGQCVRDD